VAVTELIATVRPTFQAAIKKAVDQAALGENVSWDIVLAIVPASTGPQPVYLCYVHCSALHSLGALLQRSFFVPIGAPPEVVNHIIGEQIRELFVERSRLLSAQSNGASTPLIVEGNG